MKKIYFFLIASVLFLNSSATTYTSSQNGNWMNPLSWTPVGIPVPGDIATINHIITLDTSLAYTVGSVTVSATGSLIQDAFGRDIWLNGVNASFTNNGTTTIRYLLLSSGSFSNAGNFNVDAVSNNITFTNTGNFNGVDSLLNNGTINNNGVFNIMTFLNNNTINNYNTIQGLTTVVDSMYNVGTFLNDVGALLKADSCTNSGTFTNNGVVNFNQYTNTGICTNNNYLSFKDITNTSVFNNIDSLIGTGSMTNTGNFDNKVGATINLGVSFLNADPVNFDAVFNNDGVFDMGDSFYNFDTITGGATGSFVVQDTSYNSDRMRGSFDFCDMTPPATLPYIDFNTGTVDVNITYCVGVSVAEESLSSPITIYPNPSTGVLNISPVINLKVELYTVLGERLITSNKNKLDISSYENGLYILLVKDEYGNLIKQERIIKQ